MAVSHQANRERSRAIRQANCGFEKWLCPNQHLRSGLFGWGAAGFFLAVGFGGHGFQHSPATGRYVAEWLTDGTPSMDLSLFDPGRFRPGHGVHQDAADAE